MTYAELLDRLKTFTPEQLGMTATVYTDFDEYYGLKSIEYSAADCNVLDEGHPILYTS